MLFCLSNYILFSFHLLIISDYMQPDTIINELIGKLINILMTSFPRTEEDPGLPHIFSGCGCLPTINVSTEIGLGILWAAIHCGLVCLFTALVTCPWTLSLTAYCQILTSMLMMTFVFIFPFCLVTRDINFFGLLFLFLEISCIFFLKCSVLSALLFCRSSCHFRKDLVCSGKMIHLVLWKPCLSHIRNCPV